MRIRELRAEGWRNLEPLTLVPGRAASVLSRRQRPGQDQRPRGGLLPGGAALVPHVARRGADPRRRRQRRRRRRGCARRSCTAGSSAGSRSSCDRRARVARLDGKAVRGTAAALGAVSVVLFVPEDLLLPRAAPADAAAVPRSAPSSTSSAATTTRPARSRRCSRAGTRCSSAGRPTAQLLDTYDEELARTGARVVMRRRAPGRGADAAVLRALPRAAQRAAGVARVHERSRRRRGADDEAAVRAACTPAWRRGAGSTSAAASPASGRTPTISDIGLAGAPARSHASQGQLRSLVLALKLAELSQRRGAAGRSAGAAARRRSERARSGAARAAVRRHRPARLPDAHLGHRARHRSRAAGAARFSGTRAGASLRNP